MSKGYLLQFHPNLNPPILLQTVFRIIRGHRASRTEAIQSLSSDTSLLKFFGHRERPGPGQDDIALFRATAIRKPEKQELFPLVFRFNKKSDYAVQIAQSSVV